MDKPKNKTKNNIFRQISIDRVSSPEQLDDYIKVSNPSSWVIVVATGIMLVCAAVWVTFGDTPLLKFIFN